MKLIKVLNLYAGIGGNRKLWKDVRVVAIENNKEIAKIYSDNFPNDYTIIADAHNYLLKHFQEFDFIWSSPPCQTHSKLIKIRSLSDNHQTGAWKTKPIYPDMKLYEEIIFLKHYFKGKWVVENVKPYYKPLIISQEISRHLFWCNFRIGKIKLPAGNIENGKREEWQNLLGIDISEYKINHRKDQILRNCVHPKLGLHIFNEAMKQPQKTLRTARREML